ncbi:MAG: hypothetical protein HY286_15055 [Planctomycetes bacterium]|nr:hypothetical protein [Planctomycetota bacterium]
MPDPVYELLSEVAALAPQSLIITIERDGAYPNMLQLLAQLDRAREAVAAGRARARSIVPRPVGAVGIAGRGLEAELARVFTNESVRAAFATDDPAGLAMAAGSFGRKRIAAGGPFP